MNQLNEKINELEQTVKTAIKVINELKSENIILTQEKNRLTEESNQLRLKRERGAMSTNAIDESVELGNSDINIELIKNELDQCIEDLTSYIKEHSQ